jgi:hypothetical protein
VRKIRITYIAKRFGELTTEPLTPIRVVPAIEALHWFGCVIDKIELLPEGE